LWLNEVLSLVVASGDVVWDMHARHEHASEQVTSLKTRQITAKLDGQEPRSGQKVKRRKKRLKMRGGREKD
jgi:hypothetical protein